MRAKFLGSNWFFCFISICKFGNFKNPFAMITSLSELYFRIRRFILLVKMEKVISMNYGSSKRSWKPWRWMRLDLIFSMGDIYINSNPNLLTKFTSIHQHKNSLWLFLCWWMLANFVSRFGLELMYMRWNGSLVLNLMKSQWKLWQQHFQHFPVEGKPL